MRYIITCRNIDTGVNFYCYTTSNLKEALTKFEEQKEKSVQETKSSILVSLTQELMTYIN